MQKILFICHGNICRSPMAEFIFKALARAKGLEGEYYVESAAVKTARQVTKADYERFDRLVCMDSSNVRRLRDIVGDDAQKKIHLLMSYAGVGRDVADPWYTGDFEETFQDCLTGCEAILSQKG